MNQIDHENIFLSITDPLLDCYSWDEGEQVSEFPHIYCRNTLNQRIKIWMHIEITGNQLRIT